MKESHFETPRDDDDDPVWPTMHLDLFDSFGTLLQTLSEVVSFDDGDGEKECDQRIAEYGHINDVIYAEDNSYISVSGSNGACCVKHGTVPTVFGEIPTQNLTIMKLDPLICVDRYVISMKSRSISFYRALRDNANQDPMFTVERIELTNDELEHMVLNANKDFKCIMLGSVSSRLGSDITLLKDDETIVQSAVCVGSGRGSHCLNRILDLEEGDCIKLCCFGEDVIVSNAGHLAFIQLTD